MSERDDFLGDDAPEFYEEYDDVEEVGGLPALRPGDATIVTAEDALRQLEAAEEFSRRMRGVAVRLTRPQDWVTMGDKVYLQSSGAERVAQAAGLTVEVVQTPRREERQDVKGAYYIYTTIIRTTNPQGRSVEWTGKASSRDKFFGTYTEWKGKEKIVHERAQEEIDETMIARKSQTNALVNCIKRMYGLGNLTQDDLREFGREAGAEVKFNGKAKPPKPSPKKTPLTHTDQGTQAPAPGGGASARRSTADVTVESGGIVADLRDFLETRGSETAAEFTLLLDLILTERGGGFFGTYLTSKSGPVTREDFKKFWTANLSPNRRGWLWKELQKCCSDHEDAVREAMKSL